ncbi:unnamed protein product [Amoebophrya sp. A120]|nr:unnamed protein product [Amoebophrya sp. A120]|eukprot:GSA120T00004474001.1
MSTSSTTSTTSTSFVPLVAHQRKMLSIMVNHKTTTTSRIIWAAASVVSLFAEVQQHLLFNNIQLAAGFQVKEQEEAAQEQFYFREENKEEPSNTSTAASTSSSTSATSSTKSEDVSTSVAASEASSAGSGQLQGPAPLAAIKRGNEDVEQVRGVEQAAAAAAHVEEGASPAEDHDIIASSSARPAPASERAGEQGPDPPPPGAATPSTFETSATGKITTTTAPPSRGGAGGTAPAVVPAEDPRGGKTSDHDTKNVLRPEVGSAASPGATSASEGVASSSGPMWDFDYDEEDYEQDESHLVGSSQQILSRQLGALSGRRPVGGPGGTTTTRGRRERAAPGSSTTTSKYTHKPKHHQANKKSGTKTSSKTGRRRSAAGGASAPLSMSTKTTATASTPEDKIMLNANNTNTTRESGTGITTMMSQLHESPGQMNQINTMNSTNSNTKNAANKATRLTSQEHEQPDHDAVNPQADDPSSDSRSSSLPTTSRSTTTISSMLQQEETKNAHGPSDAAGGVTSPRRDNGRRDEEVPQLQDEDVAEVGPRRRNDIPEEGSWIPPRPEVAAPPSGFAVTDDHDPPPVHNHGRRSRGRRTDSPSVPRSSHSTYNFRHRDVTTRPRSAASRRAASVQRQAPDVGSSASTAASTSSVLQKQQRREQASWMSSGRAARPPVGAAGAPPRPAGAPQPRGPARLGGHTSSSSALGGSTGTTLLGGGGGTPARGTYAIPTQQWPAQPRVVNALNGNPGPGAAAGRRTDDDGIVRYHSDPTTGAGAAYSYGGRSSKPVQPVFNPPTARPAVLLGARTPAGQAGGPPARATAGVGPPGPALTGLGQISTQQGGASTGINPVPNGAVRVQLGNQNQRLPTGAPAQANPLGPVVGTRWTNNPNGAGAGGRAGASTTAGGGGSSSVVNPVPFNARPPARRPPARVAFRRDSQLVDDEAPTPPARPPTGGVLVTNGGAPADMQLARYEAPSSIIRAGRFGTDQPREPSRKQVEQLLQELESEYTESKRPGAAAKSAQVKNAVAQVATLLEEQYQLKTNADEKGKRPTHVVAAVSDLRGLVTELGDLHNNLVLEVQTIDNRASGFNADEEGDFLKDRGFYWDHACWIANLILTEKLATVRQHTATLLKEANENQLCEGCLPDTKRGVQKLIDGKSVKLPLNRVEAFCNKLLLENTRLNRPLLKFNLEHETEKERRARENKFRFAAESADRKERRMLEDAARERLRGTSGADGAVVVTLKPLPPKRRTTAAGDTGVMQKYDELRETCYNVDDTAMSGRAAEFMAAAEVRAKIRAREQREGTNQNRGGSNLVECTDVFDNVSWTKLDQAATSEKCHKLSREIEDLLGCKPAVRDRGEPQQLPGFLRLPVKELSLTAIVATQFTRVMYSLAEPPQVGAQDLRDWLAGTEWVVNAVQAFQEKMQEFFEEVVPEVMSGLLSAQISVWIETLDTNNDGLVCPNEISTLLISDQVQKHVIDPLKSLVEAIPVPGLPKLISETVQRVWQQASSLMMIFLDSTFAKAVHRIAQDFAAILMGGAVGGSSSSARAAPWSRSSSFMENFEDAGNIFNATSTSPSTWSGAGSGTSAAPTSFLEHLQASAATPAKDGTSATSDEENATPSTTSEGSSSLVSDGISDEESNSNSNHAVPGGAGEDDHDGTQQEQSLLQEGRRTGSLLSAGGPPGPRQPSIAGGGVPRFPSGSSSDDSGELYHQMLQRSKEHSFDDLSKNLKMDLERADPKKVFCGGATGAGRFDCVMPKQEAAEYRNEVAAKTLRTLFPAYVTGATTNDWISRAGKIKDGLINIWCFPTPKSIAKQVTSIAKQASDALEGIVEPIVGGGARGAAAPSEAEKKTKKERKEQQKRQNLEKELQLAEVATSVWRRFSQHFRRHISSAEFGKKIKAVLRENLSQAFQIGGSLFKSRTNQETGQQEASIPQKILDGMQQLREWFDWSAAPGPDENFRE